MESSPPHFMQPHLKLAYPASDVRRDMHQLLLHAVRHSGNTPADKAKMFKWVKASAAAVCVLAMVRCCSDGGGGVC